MKPYGFKPSDYCGYGRNGRHYTSGHWRGWESCCFAPRSGRGDGSERSRKTRIGRRRARAEAKVEIRVSAQEVN